MLIDWDWDRDDGTAKATFRRRLRGGNDDDDDDDELLWWLGCGLAALSAAPAGDDVDAVDVAVAVAVDKCSVSVFTAVLR